MTTTFEDRLRRSMRQGAGAAEPPAPPDLRAGARRRAGRRRSVVAVLGSAGLVAAIVAVPQLWERRSPEAPPATPSPSARLALSIEDLPKGEPPTVPYLRDGVLQGAGRDDRWTGTSLIAGGDELLLEDDRRWSLRTTSGFEALDGVVDIPALSPDGRTLVYVSAASGTGSGVALLALDLDGGVQRIGVRTLPAAPDGGGTPVRLLGVDNQRRVFWAVGSGDGERFFVWWPETDRQQQVAFGWEGDRIVAVGPEEVLVAHAAGRQGYVGPLVSDDVGAAVKKRWPVLDPEISVFSPGGGHLFQHSTWITRVDGDAGRVRLRLDGSIHPEVLGLSRSTSTSGRPSPAAMSRPARASGPWTSHPAPSWSSPARTRSQACCVTGFQLGRSAS